MAGKSSNGWTRRTILRWHRRIGLVSSLLILVLTVTGVLLLRTEQLGLDRTMVRSERLANWYGLDAGGPATSFAAGDHWVTVVDGFVYLDGELAGDDIDEIVGVVHAGEQIIIAGRGGLYVLEPEGLIIEPDRARAPPAEIISLATTPAGRIVIKTLSGVFISPIEAGEWQQFSGSARWSAPATPPPQILSDVRQAHGPGGLPVSRLLLDLHTGRLFGAWGPYLMDMAAIFLILLTASGVYNWWKGWRR